MRYPLPQKYAQHAIGLAQIAEYVVVTARGQQVARADLVLTQLPDAGGVLVWAKERRTHVLHVGVQGQVYCYRPGRWERRLVQLAKQPAPPARHVQVTLDVDDDALRQAETYVHATRRQGRRNPLEQLGLAAAEAARARRDVLTH
jgi:hypothetical protein